MTKETKIGLLVGLAFIVLFAIILSERGTAHRDSKAPAFAFMDQSKKSSNVTTDQPLGDMGRVPVENQLPPIVRPSTTRVPVMSPIQEERVPTVAQRDDEPLEELPAELVNSLNLPRVVDPMVQETPVDSPTKLAVNTPATNTVGAARSGEVSLTPTQPTKDLLASGKAIDRAAGGSESAGQAPPSKDDLDRIAKQVAIRVRSMHEVQPGESLGKIAAKYYGRSTPARVDALFDANRDVLKDPAAVKAKTTLKIPDLGEGFEPAPEFVLSESKRQTPVTKTEPVKATSKEIVADRAPAPTGPANSALRIPVPIRERGPGESIQLAISKPPIGAAAAEPQTSTDRPDAGKPDGKSKPMAYRWYEVKRNDTLSRIARRELGGERYVKTLYEFNQDILKSRHNLKPGMKIRVPAKVGGSTELNVQSARGNGDGEP